MPLDGAYCNASVSSSKTEPCQFSLVQFSYVALYAAKAAATEEAAQHIAQLLVKLCFVL